MTGPVQSSSAGFWVVLLRALAIQVVALAALAFLQNRYHG